MASTMAMSIVPKLSDVICPICLCILIEPVTMPCSHELCMSCFKQNVNETSLTCPMCRTRISSWTRKATRENKLINEERWKVIQNTFPHRVRRRLNGLDEEETDNDDQIDESDIEPGHLLPLARPGEIRKEYEEFLIKAKQEEELENKRSEILIKSIQEREKDEEMKRKRIANRDCAIAKILAEKINEVSVDDEQVAMERTLTQIGDLLRPSSSGALLNRRCRAKTQMYPIRSRKTKSCNDSPRRDVKSLTIKVKGREPGKETSAKDVEGGNASAEQKPIADSETDSSTDESQASEQAAVRAPPVRSKSIESEDSINEELRHFRPIKVAPKTPPRRLPDGRIGEEPKLIRATPRNLMSQLESGENSVAKPAESTWIRKRLAVMHYDRRNKVSIMSNPAECSSSTRSSVSLSRQQQPLTPVPQPVANFSSVESRFVAPKALRETLHRSDKCVQALVDKENPIRNTIAFTGRKWKSRNITRVSDDHNNNVKCSNVTAISKKPEAVQIQANAKLEVDDRLLAIRLQRQLNNEIGRDPYCIDRRKGTPGAYNLRQRRTVTS